MHFLVLNAIIVWHQERLFDSLISIFIAGDFCSIATFLLYDFCSIVAILICVFYSIAKVLLWDFYSIVAIIISFFVIVTILFCDFHSIARNLVEFLNTFIKYFLLRVVISVAFPLVISTLIPILQAYRVT